MKTVVISASASLQSEIKKWVTFWHNRGYRVLKYPKPIGVRSLLKDYPIIHRKFYRALTKTDIHFIANETKGNKKGYIGNGVFAEIAFTAGLNLVRKKEIKILLLNKPHKKNKFYNDLNVWWLKLGWLQIFNKTKSYN